MSVEKKIFLDADLLFEWGTEKLTTSHQKKFLRYFKVATGKVLEIGCGRGIMLDMMKKAGIDAYGLDSSDDAVNNCLQKGLKAIHGDAVTHLSSLPSASLGGIFCAHVIEHMKPTYAIDFIRESYRVLRPEAPLIIITPNPRDLRIMERFWLDITHERPYPEKLLKSLLRKEGFSTIKLAEDKEPAKTLLHRLAKLLLRIWFMGFMFRGDLIVVAKH